MLFLAGFPDDEIHKREERLHHLHKSIKIIGFSNVYDKYIQKHARTK